MTTTTVLPFSLLPTLVLLLLRVQSAALEATDKLAIPAEPGGSVQWLVPGKHGHVEANNGELLRALFPLSSSQRALEWL